MSEQFRPSDVMIDAVVDKVIVAGDGGLSSATGNDVLVAVVMDDKGTSAAAAAAVMIVVVVCPGRIVFVAVVIATAVGFLLVIENHAAALNRVKDRPVRVKFVS